MRNESIAPGSTRVGRAQERVEDLRLLRGAGRFVDDIVLPGMLHAVIVRSPQAHGRIVGIETSAARALEGVHAVYTAADLGAQTPIPVRVGRIEGLERFLQHPLPSDVVRYVGEPVAVVVADDRYIAEDAADLVFIEIDAADACVSMDDAESGSSIVHAAAGTNVAADYTVERGQAQQAFVAAAYVRTERFHVQRHSSVPMETRGLVASVDEAGGRMQVWGAAKVPFYNRRLLQEMLGMPVDMIEVDVGGSFGARGEFYPEDFLIPFAARALRRPVKWIEDRRENLLAMNHSRDVECLLSIACDKDGTLLALRAEIRADMGAYARTTGGIVAAKAASFLPGPYRVPNYQCRVKVLATNKTPSGTYRGPGRYEANFFRERLMEMAAADLRIDPVEFRLRNLIQPAEMPYPTGRLVPYENGSEYDGGDYPAALRTALDKLGYDTLRMQQGRLIGGRYHGIGIACFVDSSGAGPAEHARLCLLPDGRFELRTGTSSSGQGHETTFAQILADELQVPMDRITVLHGSTNLLPEGVGTYHGRGLVMGGSAVKLAGQRFRQAFVSEAARQAGRDAEALVYEAGAVKDKATGSLVLSLEQVCAQSSAGAGALAGLVQVDAKFEQSKLTYEYGTQLAHVAVDPVTAEVEVLRLVTVEDCGVAINPLIVHGQVLGASVQGLGGAFLEEFTYDESGQMTSGSFADYLLPTSTDFPNVEAHSVCFAPSTLNPLGAKGVGEGGIEGAGAAAANAVSNALRSLGVEIRSLPISPNRLAGLIREARGADPEAGGRSVFAR